VVVPAQLRAGSDETQRRELLPQGMSAWVKYSRRRNRVARQKLPGVSGVIKLSEWARVSKLF